tara:strand:+ start:1192 stop:1728 length:537 start_codon:yes stop_codon:yes gene_type:complete
MSQETPIGSLNNMNDEDSKLVESILNDLNGSPQQQQQQPQQQQQQGPPQQQHGEQMTPEQMKAIQMQRQMAMQQQQQQLMAQQQQIAHQQRMSQQKPSTENIITNDTDSLIDNIKKESKSIILVIILSFIMSIEKVNSVFKVAPSLFLSEDGSVNLQGALIKSLILGVVYYLVKTYLF